VWQPPGCAAEHPLIIDCLPLLVAFPGVSHRLVSFDIDLGQIALDRASGLGFPHHLLGLVAMSVGNFQMPGMDFFAAELGFVLAGAVSGNLRFSSRVVKDLTAAELVKGFKCELL
jgi:hypothetical protein